MHNKQTIGVWMIDAAFNIICLSMLLGFIALLCRQ